MAESLSKNAWQPPTLTTERLILRPITLEDAQDIFNYAQNPNVSRYTLWEPHQTIDDSVSYIKDYIMPYYSKKVPEPLGITLRVHPQKIIGTVGCFWVSEKSRSMELAYALAEEYWGKGIVAEASIVLMNYCFKEYSLKRIQAQCSIENVASARVMEKCGMQFEGTRRSSLYHREKFWDMACYAKINQE